MVDLARQTLDVAIVGAGAAGLAAAMRLSDRRPDLVVGLFEAGSRIGGRAHTVTAGSPAVPVDLGCGWLHGASANAWTAEAARLGFAVDRTPAPWDGGGRHMGLSDAEREASEQARHAFFERAERWPAEEPDAPMSDLLEPGGRWNAMIDAVGTYLNGVELDRASIRDYQRYDPGPSPDWRVRDGYGALVARFGAGLPVALEMPVRRIDHRAATQVRVETAHGVVLARAVIVAVPTDALAREKIVFDPPLPGKGEAASRLPLGLAEKLFLTLEEPEAFAIEGHLLGSPLRVGTGAYHIRPFGRPVVECYFAGGFARDLHRAGHDAALAVARDELAAHLGSAIRDRVAFAAMSAWQSDPFIGGAYAYAGPGDADQRAALATPVDDRIFFAGEATAPRKFSTAHGAYESGVAAADGLMTGLERNRLEV